MFNDEDDEETRQDDKISKGPNFLKTSTHQRAQSSCEASIEASYTDEFRVSQQSVAAEITPFQASTTNVERK